MSALIWNKEFELYGESYSVSDTQDYFEYIIKKHKTFINNPPVRIYVNKIENAITLKKAEYYFEFLTPKTMKLLGSTKSKITKEKDIENVPNLEITKAALVHCNIVNDDHQQDSRVLYTFIPNISFGQLLDISPTNFQ